MKEYDVRLLRSALKKWHRGHLREVQLEGIVRQLEDGCDLPLRSPGVSTQMLQRVVLALGHLTATEFLREDVPVFLRFVATRPGDEANAWRLWSEHWRDVEYTDRRRRLAHKTLFRRNPLPTWMRKRAEQTGRPPNAPPPVEYVDREHLLRLMRGWEEGVLSERGVHEEAELIVEQYGVPWCAEDDPAWPSIEVVSVLAMLNVHRVTTDDIPEIRALLGASIDQQVDAVQAWIRYWRELDHEDRVRNTQGNPYYQGGVAGPLSTDTSN